jgi:hypothetical protein
MNDLKNDSNFVVKLTLLVAGFFMFCYSKIGTYILVQIGTLGYCLYWHYTQGIPFVNFFVASALFVSVVFEIFFPVVFDFTQSTYLELKKEYNNAYTELKRRRSGIPSEQ